MTTAASLGSQGTTTVILSSPQLNSGVPGPGMPVLTVSVGSVATTTVTLGL